MNKVVLDVATEIGVIAGMDKVFSSADAIANDCKDFTLLPIGFDFESNIDEVLMIINEKKYVMSDLALAQYLKIAKIQFGIGYMRQMLVNQKADLAVDNLIEWPLEPREYFIRTYKNKVRSFLSNKYADYTNLEFLEAINAELSSGESSFAVSSYMMDENFMSLYVSERQSFYRDFNMGLVFQNSEVGTGSVTIRVAVITPKKSNIVLRQLSGMDFIRQRHIGKQEDIKPYTSAGVGPVGRDNFKERINEFVSHIPVLANNLQQKLEKAEKKVVDVVKAIEETTSNLKLSKKRMNELMVKFPPQKTMNVLDFLTELTNIGAQYPILQSDIELYAGDILERV